MVPQALAAFADFGTALLTPALAWQSLQQTCFVETLPTAVSAWLRVFDHLHQAAEHVPPHAAALLTAMHGFWFHAFAWHLPHLHHDVPLALTACYDSEGFADPRVLVALHQWLQSVPQGAQAPQKTSPHTAPAPLDISALNVLYAKAHECFHAYRLHSPLQRAGWCHSLALALHIPASRRPPELHPFLVNALKAAWNDSEQQRLFVHTVLQAMPEDYAPYQPFRVLYHRFLRGRKALDQVRRTQDRLYHQWQAAKPLKPLIQNALQDLLHQGQVGSVFVFVRHETHYTPLHVKQTPYAYRQEAGQWRWRSHDSFSQSNPRDQGEKLAHQQLQETLTTLHQQGTSQASLVSNGLHGTKAVQSRWWSAGECLLIDALNARRLARHVKELQASSALLWYEDPVLRDTFLDACERMACEHRANLQVSADLRACAQQLYDSLSPGRRTPSTEAAAPTLCDALNALSLAQVQQALAPLTERLPFYLCWARRQTGGVPVDGFCQPLMYEQAGDQRVPAVLLWGEVHRAPETSVGLLPFVSRLHMYELTPLSDLMGYWASDSLLQWRQDLHRLRVQQQRKDEEYQRIQRAFEKIRQCREQENLAWAELRNQLDPPELLSYGVASNEALKQSYTRLHRPEQITSPEALLCFFAELSTGKTHECAAEAEETLRQLHKSSPHTLVAELFDYWTHLPPAQHTLSTAQALFNYCKIMVYDGSQVESQLPGTLSLAQLTYTFHRMAQQANILSKRLQRPYALSLHLAWQTRVFNAAKLSLRRMLESSALQTDVMGISLNAIHDTRQISPCFTLGQEQLAISVMEALYALYTTHFSPALEASDQHLWVKALQGQVTATQGCQLRFVLSGSFSDAARHKLSQNASQAPHDLRRTLHQLREGVGVSADEPWFFTPEDEPSMAQSHVYFCQSSGQDKHTELVVHLAV